MKMSSPRIRKPRRAVPSFDLATLEQRRLFAVTAVSGAIGPISVNPGTADQTFSLTGDFVRSGTVVSMPVSYGVGADQVNTTLNITLFDQTPITTANFLKYITSGKYAESIFHRNAFSTDSNGNRVPFVLQGGGYTTTGQDIGDFGTIVNEFSLSPRNADGEVNTLGTLAMAKTANNPNSASSEFFINLADNSSNLDNQNGGFTTFGKLFDSSLPAVQAIAALQTGDATNINSAWDSLPVADYDSNQGLVDANFVKIGQATINSTPAQTFTYTATSSNTGIVNASIDGNGNLVLDYGDTTGTTTVTVTGTDPSGASASITFAVSVDFLKVQVNGQTVNNNQTMPVVIANRDAGSPATDATLTITNNDPSSLSVSGFSVPNGFQLIGAEPITLAPGESKTYTLEFNATDSGSYNGNVTINSGINAFTFPVLGTIGVSPGVLGVTTGGATVTSGQSTPVNVGVGSSVKAGTKSFVVTNNGEVAVTLSPATVDAGFTITQQLPSTLAPGASATLIVAVDASTAVGTKTGTLTIPNNGSTSTIAIPLSGAVARTVTLNATTTSVTFIDDGGSTTKYTYKGAGSVTLALTGASADATIKGKAAVFTDTGIELSDIVFDGTTNATSSLTASVKGGDAASTVGSITATATLGTLKLPGVTVTNLMGTTLTSLTAAAINGTVTTGVAAGAIAIGDLSGATLTLSNDIKTFTANSITNSTVTLSGPDSVAVKGAITGSTVSVTGAPKSFSAASVSSSTINSAAGVGNVTVKGAVASSTFNLVGPITSIKTGALTSSNLNIGVSSTDGSFLGTSTAKTISFASISKSTLAVSSATTINLGSFTTDADDLTTVKLKTAKSLTGTGTSKFSLKNIATGTDVTTAPTAAGLPSTRLAITVAS